MDRRFHTLTLITAAVTLCVIVLGAWVRLSHAGLGCPDWPGCYGQLTWPDAPTEIAGANAAFPERPVEVDKAWKEMVHRYLAGILMLLVLTINIFAWRGGEALKRHRKVAGILGGLIIFQALLGMWTVTLKLLPIIVMGHLLGGMATLSLLTWLAAGSRPPRRPDHGAAPVVQIKMRVALVVLVAQIALGGWTSANYAALSCPDLPQCTGQWWPQTDFAEGFKVFREIGVDYEGGVLDQSARVAIHLTHRIGAVITFLLILAIALKLTRRPDWKGPGLLMFALVSVQFVLGLLNVALKLPLANAVAHNGVAAVLLATLVWNLHRAGGIRDH